MEKVCARMIKFGKEKSRVHGPLPELSLAFLVGMKLKTLERVPFIT